MLIKELKTKVAKQLNQNERGIILVCNGKYLDNGKKVGECKLK
jgi:hypothetical protein